MTEIPYHAQAEKKITHKGKPTKQTISRYKPREDLT